MNHLKQKGTYKGIAATLSLTVLMMLALPPKLSADVCDKALIKCMVDAGIAAVLGTVVGFFAGNIPGALLGVAAAGGVSLAFCLVGFDFCKRYYI